MRVAMVALLAWLALAPASALAAPPRASFNDIEDEVMCDTCNVPLNIAESDRADQERVAIRRLIARGLTKQQILPSSSARMARHPRQAAGQRLQPRGLVGPGRRRGRARRAAGGAAAALAPARRRGGGDEGAREPALSSAEARRLDEDLARYDV